MFNQNSTHWKTFEIKFLVIDMSRSLIIVGSYVSHCLKAIQGEKQRYMFLELHNTISIFSNDITCYAYAIIVFSKTYCASSTTSFLYRISYRLKDFSKLSNWKIKYINIDVKLIAKCFSGHLVIQFVNWIWNAVTFVYVLLKEARKHVCLVGKTYYIHECIRITKS